MTVLGVDIGGSGIKAALVDVEKGVLVTERERVKTPKPSSPEAVGEVVRQLHKRFDGPERVGICFPAVVRHGVTLSAANVDDSWIGAPAREIFSRILGVEVAMLNDADAAGIAEEKFGAAADHDGVVLLLTLGTGIGSALIVDGRLVPNTELGHLELDGHDPVESWASSKVRKTEQLSYEEWGPRVGVLLRHLDMLFSPDLFIIGGGISKKFHRFSEFLGTDPPVVPATMGNQAGIVGAAMAATQT
ncbi:MAG: ROK family protein [Acidimicrobiia bacterium]|nr:ROK family protein [Acidimicrobiia bacterium]